MNILKLVRKELGLTQTELAEKIGISRSQVGNIEQGSRNITDRIKKDLVTYLNVNPEWIETGMGEIILNKYKGYDLTDKEKEFLDLLNQLDPDSQKLVIDTMKKIAN